MAYCGNNIDLLSQAPFYANDRPEGQGNPGKATRSGESSVCNRCAAAACLYPAVLSPERFGFQACGSFPLHFQGRVWAEEALRASEEKYRLVFENAPLGIMHYDQHGTITDLNDKFIEIIGSSREKLIGFNMPQQLLDEKMCQAVTDSLTGGAGYYEGEYVSVTGGKKTQVRTFYRGVFSETGAFLGGGADLSLS